MECRYVCICGAVLANPVYGFFVMVFICIAKFTQ